MEFVKQLEEYGLNQKEADIYLAMLGSGPVSISDIAKRAGVKRSTTYQYIESLMEKKLLHKTATGKRTLYIVESPQKLLSLIEQKKKRMEAFLPELQALYATPAKQAKIRFYEGKEGLRTVYEELFNTTQIIYAVFSPEKCALVFTDEENSRFLNILREAGGQIHNILEDSKKAREHLFHKYRKGIQRTKFLPPDFKSATDILVVGDKVILISFLNVTAVVIENADIANTQRGVLKLLWKSL